MGITDKYDIPYPEPTDPIADGADAIRDLAERLDMLLSTLLDTPGYVLAMATDTLPNVSPASIDNEAAWGPAASVFAPETGSLWPDSGNVEVVVLVTGTVTAKSGANGRRIARAKLDFDPGSGSWTSSETASVEVNGPDQRSGAIALTGSQVVSAAQAASVRWRVTANQLTLGSNGDLTFREGRSTAWAFRA